MPQPADILVQICRQAVSRLAGEALTSRFAFPGEGPVSVAALGKAAPSMLRGACQALGARLVRSWCCGLEKADLPGCESWTGGHPYMTEGSLRAGEALVQWLAEAREPVWILLSGGASAMVELPRPGAGLSDFVEMTRRSFREGWDIERLNRERASLSQIKGGGLAWSSPAGVLVMSDVPPGSERWVGSGPFWTEETASRHHVLASRLDAAREAVRALEDGGLHVRSVESMDGNLPAFVEDRLLPAASDLRPGEALVWHGEPTLQASGPGTGGRCQHLVLLAAPRLGPCVVLAAGTDGRDGPSPYAGAASGVQKEDDEWLRAVQDQDSSTWMERRGLAIPSWSTGCNLNDLAILARFK